MNPPLMNPAPRAPVQTPSASVRTDSVPSMDMASLSIPPPTYAHFDPHALLSFCPYCGLRYAQVMYEEAMFCGGCGAKRLTLYNSSISLCLSLFVCESVCLSVCLSVYVCVSVYHLCECANVMLLSLQLASNTKIRDLDSEDAILFSSDNFTFSD
ncbi:hypothetical protein ADUPG1_010747, partial [Aduncisulcus paluster]